MNKHSKVLALKYRPQTFEDLIGQNFVAETITNSIKDNKVPNAYLFTGIRGVGKTTLARIVAKALNCKNGFDKLCKINFCENWYQKSFDPNFKSLPLENFKPLVYKIFSRKPYSS